MVELRSLLNHLGIYVERRADVWRQTMAISIGAEALTTNYLINSSIEFIYNKIEKF